MSLLKKLTVFALIFAFTSVGAVYAQQPQPNAPAAGNPQARWMMRRKMMRRRERMGALGGIRQLNLTDQQRQQARSLRQSFAQSTQSQRQELHQLMEQRRTGALTADKQARAKRTAPAVDAGKTEHANTTFRVAYCGTESEAR